MSDLETLLSASVEIIELKARIHELEAELAEVEQCYTETSGELARTHFVDIAKLEARIRELEAQLDEPDGAPYCQYCGAKRKKDCDCGPIAENN
jgi:BMFP domain-containing protein YqiC